MIKSVGKTQLWAEDRDMDQIYDAYNKLFG